MAGSRHALNEWLGKRQMDPVLVPLERDVLSAVLQLCRAHPKVAWIRRMNTGTRGGVNFGFPGLSDLIGQLKDGRMLAIEVKRPGKMPTEAQVEFMGEVARWHGVAFVARGIQDVLKALG